MAGMSEDLNLNVPAVQLRNASRLIGIVRRSHSWHGGSILGFVESRHDACYCTRTYQAPRRSTFRPGVRCKCGCPRVLAGLAYFFTSLSDNNGVQ
jgi:hypothetical protein